MPFTQSALSTYLNALPYYLNEVESRTRNVFLGLTLKLLDRARAATFQLQNRLGSSYTATDSQSNQSADHANSFGIIAYHRRFIISHISILRSNLHPLSSYQVIWASLKSLEILQQSGLDPLSRGQNRRTLVSGNSISWPFSVSIFTNQLLRSLLDLLWSPFDDIRTLASTILRDYDPDLLRPKKDSTFSDALLSLEKRSEVKAEHTGRSDHADGQARIYELRVVYGTRELRRESIESLSSSLELVLDRLEEKLCVAKQDLGEAVSSRPIHGELIGIRFVRYVQKLQN
jgi:hypothetical protein